MSVDQPADAQVIDELRTALAGLNKALAAASTKGIRVEIGSTERKFVSQAVPQTVATLRATRMRTEIDERF